MAFDLTGLSIREIRARLPRENDAIPRGLLRALQADPRRGVQALYAALRERVEQTRRERRRLARMFRLERALWRRGVRYVAGVDEVGVGPLAGPVVAAAVMFEPGTLIEGVDDSKRLDPQTRARLDVAIRACAVGVGIGMASAREIDRLNVYHAGLLAMRRAVTALPVPARHLLVDARTIPDLSVSQQGLIRGDGTSFSIAAASIVAKTYRDRLMGMWDRRYPQYGFSRHKGYGTPEHQTAIRRHGPCPLHRRSYPFLQELRGFYSPRFYEIRDRLAQVRAAPALRAIERTLARDGVDLGELERRKLKLLIARRRRVVA